MPVARMFPEVMQLADIKKTAKTPQDAFAALGRVFSSTGGQSQNAPAPAAPTPAARPAMPQMPKLDGYSGVMGNRANKPIQAKMEPDYTPQMQAFLRMLGLMRQPMQGQNYGNEPDAHDWLQKLFGGFR